MHKFLFFLKDKLSLDEETLKQVMAVKEKGPYRKSVATFDKNEIKSLDLKLFVLKLHDLNHEKRFKCQDFDYDLEEKKLEDRVDKNLSENLPFFLLPQLEELTCHSGIKSIDLSKNLLLKRFNAHRSRLSLLDLSNNINIEEVSTLKSPYNPGPYEEIINEFVFPQNNKIKKLVIGGNDLSKVDFTKFLEIEYLHVGFSNLSEINLSRSCKLKTLDILRNNLKEIDLSSNPSITDLCINSNNLGQLDISNLSHLTYLTCSQNNIANLDLTNNPLLLLVRCSDNKIKELDATSNKFLRIIYTDKFTKVKFDVRHVLYMADFRKKFNIPKDILTTLKINDKVLEYNWDDGTDYLKRMVKNPLCDKTTALTVYWLAVPSDIYAYKNEPSEKENLKLLKLIENNIKEDFYKTNLFEFDPSDIQGAISISEYALTDSNIPEYMKIGFANKDRIEDIVTRKD